MLSSRRERAPMTRGKFWGPKRGRSGCITAAVLGIPNAPRGDNIKSGCWATIVLVGQTWARWVHHPCNVKGSNSSSQGEHPKWLVNPFGPVGPKARRVDNLIISC